MKFTPESFVEHSDAKAYILRELPPLVVRLSALAISRVNALEGLKDSSIFQSEDSTIISDVTFTALSYDPYAIHSEACQTKQQEKLEDLRIEKKEHGLNDTDEDRLAELEAYADLSVADRVGSKVAAKLHIARIRLDNNGNTLSNLDIDAAEATPNILDYFCGPDWGWAPMASLLGFDGMLFCDGDERLDITPDVGLYTSTEEGRAMRKIVPSALVRMIDIFKQSKDEDITVNLPVTLQ